MSATLFRAADLPASTPHRPIVRALRRIGKVLSSLALGAVERLASTKREPPSEYYRFPLF